MWAPAVRIGEDGRVRSRGIMIAIGVNTEGYRSPWPDVGDWLESVASWSEFFSSLKDADYEVRDLITSDDQGGGLLARYGKEAAARVTWQRCQTHFTRNVLEAHLKPEILLIHGRLRSILDAPDTGTARFLLKQT
ncbi:transposase [Paenibacillus larvae]|nr:transposase [Paenibacillus larvae]MDT2242294.1 transposase [Paenibacillus larvae]